MIRRLSDLFLGVRSILSAIKIILTHPTVLILSTVVGFIALILSGFGIYTSIEFGPDIGKWFWEVLGLQGLETSVDRSDFWGEVAYQCLYWTREILEWASMLIGIVTALLILPWLVVLLGFPLCIPLSERTDTILGGKPADHSIFTSIRLSIISIIMTTVIGVSVTVFLYVLTFVPIIGPIFTFLGTFVWPQLVLAYAVFENSLDRRGLNFRQKIGFVRRRLLASWCVGIQTQLLIGFPILNLVGLPLAVVGGAVAVRRIEDSTDEPLSSAESLMDVEKIEPALATTDDSANHHDAIPAANANTEDMILVGGEHASDDAEVQDSEGGVQGQTNAMDSAPELEPESNRNEQQS